VTPAPPWLAIPRALLQLPHRLFVRLQRSRSWLVALPILALAVLLMAEAFDPRVYNGGDNALYWALGRSIAEQGEYRDLGAPGQPSETSIAWGYPALLALGMKVLPGGGTPAGYTHLKWISFAALLAAFACLWGLLQHLLRGHRALAAAVLLLCVVNYRLLCYGSLLLTEAPYLLFSLGALLAFEGYRSRADARWWGILPAISLASYAYLIRPVGAALVAALLGYLLLSRRWLALAVALVVVAGVAGSWHVRCWVTPSDEENLYLSYLVKESKFQAGDERVDAGGIVQRVKSNAYNYARRPLTQLSLASKWKKPQLHWIAVVMTALIAVGFGVSLARPGPLHLYLPLYGCLLLAWLPESVKDRYLAMIFPLLLALALLALWWLLRRWPSLAAWAVIALVWTMLVPQVTLTEVKLARCQTVRDAWADGYEHKLRRRSYRSYVQLCKWVGRRAKNGVVLAARKPRLAYYYSGCAAVRVTYAGAPDEVFSWLVENEVDYLLLDHIDTRVTPTRDRMKATLEAYPDHFLQVYETSGRDTVWRFESDPGDLELHRPRPDRGKRQDRTTAADDDSAAGFSWRKP
jgi:hypothetical protein